MRQLRETDFFVPLPEVGTFRFGRRTFGDRLAIRAEYLRLVKEHGDEDPDLSLFAGMIATHSVLCVEAPDGWSDLAALELNEDTDAKVFELYRELKDKEDSFRKGVTKSGEGEGPGTS